MTSRTGHDLAARAGYPAAHLYMPKRRPSARRLDPDDVLAGRIRPSIGELLDLIHRVNPTGQGLAPRRAEIRYTVKSRLQSLLVRAFAGDIEVVADPAHEGTVSLIHRGHGRDACHAVIAELEDDARAWVQLQLDLGGSAAEDVSPPAKPAARKRAEEAWDDALEDDTPEALVRHAERAIEAYDYELARACLERATATRGGAAGPAAALLALLVETLGDDAAALDVEASLGREAMADPAVRGPLAIAAARLGQEDRAVALSRGLAPDRAAGVFAALAAAALGAGDVDRAADHLDRATRSDPAHPARGSLEAEIARARASLRGPAEAEIARLLEAGRDEEAARRTGEVLGRWPESEAARRALRLVEERRQRSEAQRLADEASAALAGGEAMTAIGLLRRALVLVRGAERAGVEQRIVEIEAEQRAKREAALAGAVAGRLDEPDPREGLAAYLDLDEAVRRRVREARPRDELRWLDLVEGGRGSAHAKVEAVTALARARGIAAEDPGAALGLLSPHLGLLERVPEARRALDAARARLAQQRTARAREALRAAKAARDPAQVLARLDESILRDLPDDERAEAAALRARRGGGGARGPRGPAPEALRGGAVVRGPGDRRGAGEGCRGRRARPLGAGAAGHPGGDPALVPRRGRRRSGVARRRAAPGEARRLRRRSLRDPGRRPARGVRRVARVLDARANGGRRDHGGPAIGAPPHPGVARALPRRGARAAGLARGPGGAGDRYRDRGGPDLARPPGSRPRGRDREARPVAHSPCWRRNRSMRRLTSSGNSTGT